MEVKKTKRASLEKSKSVFTLFGMILTLSLVWFAFEYKVYDKVYSDNMVNPELNAEEDVILQTKRIVPPPPPPPPRLQAAVIEIVANDTKVDDILILNIETNENDIIALQVDDDEEEEVGPEDVIFVFVEDPPEYPGGDEARLRYLLKTITYPEMAQQTGIQGTVHLTFVVEKSGRISNVEVRRGIGGGCDEEAVNAIKGMPNWKPGKQRSRAVRTQFDMPVKFILSD